MPLAVGDIVEGTVTGITKFGAFVTLESGESGLVHISEIGDKYVKDISECLKIKEKVKVKVISIDESGRINFSIKQSGETKKKSAQPELIDFSGKSEEMSFEDQMNRFKRDSEERLSDLKRNIESKRGSGGYKKRHF